MIDPYEDDLEKENPCWAYTLVGILMFLFSPVILLIDFFHDLFHCDK